MRSVHLIIQWMLLLSFLHSVYSQNNSKIILAIEQLIPHNVEQSAANIITDRLRAELINANIFRIMERGQMDVILKEQGFQQSGGCDAECLVEVGQLLGVDQMIVGTVGKIGELFTISARMLDVETGEVLFTVNNDYEGKISGLLSIAVPIIANNIVVKSTLGSNKKALIGQSGVLHIESSFLGATVLIDDLLQKGTTPLTLKNFPAGDHNIVVKKNGYAGQTLITLKPNDLLKVSVELKQSKGDAMIFSEPPGALVFVDQRQVGNAPIKVSSLFTGQHKIKLSHEGYIPIYSKLDITSEKMISKTYTLKKAGYISFNITPSKAQIYVNDILLPATQYQNLELPVGQIQVKVRYPEHVHYQKDITIRAGTNLVQNITLTYKYASLSVKSSVPGTQVLLNNTHVGNTPWYDDTLIPQKYTLNLQAVGWQTITDPIILVKDSVTKKEYTLVRTKHWKDSVATAHANQLAQSRQNKITTARVITAALAISGSVFAILNTIELNKKNDEANESLANYKSAIDSFGEYKTQYEEAKDSAEDASQNRLIGLIASGIGLAGFGITFMF